MPGIEISQSLWAKEKIMPIERLELDQMDAVEIRNLQMWVNRELKVFRNKPATQEAIADNIDKTTYLPLGKIAEAMFGG